MWHSFITFQKQLNLKWHFLDVHALFLMSLFSSGQAFQLVLFPFFCLAWLRPRETWLHGCLASAMAVDCGGTAPLWSHKHSQHACLLMLLHGVDDALSSLTFTTREDKLNVLFLHADLLFLSGTRGVEPDTVVVGKLRCFSGLCKCHERLKASDCSTIQICIGCCLMAALKVVFYSACEEKVFKSILWSFFMPLSSVDINIQQGDFCFSAVFTCKV